MNSAKLVVSYEDYISDAFFAQFLTESRDAGTPVELESRPSGPTMGIAWMLATAVVVLVGKPFLDDILKRAASDVGKYVYPKLKTAISTLAAKVLCSTAWRRVTASGQVPREGRSAFFSIESETRERLKVQFVFEEGRAAADYDTAVDQALRVLREHHMGTNPDPLADAPVAWGTKIYMGFENERRVWIPLDVNEEVQKEYRKQFSKSRPRAGDARE